MKPATDAIDATLARLERQHGLADVCRCMTDVTVTMNDGSLVDVPAAATWLCSACGAQVSAITGFDVMSTESIELAWGNWSAEQREDYRGLLRRAKPFEVEDRQAATWACLQLRQGRKAT